MKAYLSKCNGFIPNNENDLIDKSEEKDEVEPCHSIICGRVGRRHFWIEEEFMRSNRVPQRDKRAKAEYGLDREMKCFTRKRNRA